LLGIKGKLDVVCKNKKGSLIPYMEDIRVLDDYIIHMDRGELGEVEWKGN